MSGNEKELHNIQSEAMASIISPDKTILLAEGEVSPVLSWSLSDNKTGKILCEGGPVKSKSFLKGFIQLLTLYFYGPATVPPDIAFNCVGLVKDTIGTEDLPTRMDEDYFFYTVAGVGIVTHGILVGSGVTLPVFTDNKIETLIAHGTAAGQLQYAAGYYGEPTESGGVSRFRISRIFSNNSGAPVTAGEVGLACRAYQYPRGAFYVLLIRDLFPVPLAIPNGQSLTVNYDLQAAV